MKFIKSKILKFKYLLLLTAILLVSCNSQKGYSDLDKLYSDFVKYLKDSNLENLKNYCYRVNPDQATVDYMKKIIFHIEEYLKN